MYNVGKGTQKVYDFWFLKKPDEWSVNLYVCNKPYHNALL